MDRFAWLVLINGGACAAGGLWPIFRSRRGEPGTIVHGFAAGTLLGAALLLLLGEASPTLGDTLGIPVLAGFLTLYLLDRVLLGVELGHGEGHAEAGHAHHLGLLSLVGFAVHTLVEGVALGFTQGHAEVGVAVCAGIVLHEIPSKFVLARLLIASGFRRAVVAAIVVAVAGLLVGGAFATAQLASSFPAVVAPWGLAYSAGMFVFLATSEILPREHGGKRGRFANMLAFIAGIVLAYVARYFAHNHA